MKGTVIKCSGLVVLVFLMIMAAVANAVEDNRPSELLEAEERWKEAPEIPAEIQSLTANDFTIPPQTVIRLKGKQFARLGEPLSSEIWFKVQLREDRAVNAQLVFSSSEDSLVEAYAAEKLTGKSLVGHDGDADDVWYYHRMVLLRSGEDTRIDRDAVPLPDDFGALSCYGGLLEIPVMTRYTIPEYPSLAQNAGIEGTVWIKVLVDTKGKVVRAAVHKSSGNHEIDEAALKASRKSRFNPATLAGKPVRLWVTYKAEFTLDQ
ncbi:MAG: energy transducer TonB, partial [candidate division Zixibacteria bacterium]|nr:energy transducer TonB [candidate division Zixibacteria bacterium]